MIDTDHIHKPRNYSTYRCRSCGEVLRWNREWGEWNTWDEWAELVLQDPDWLSDTLQELSNNYCFCIKNVIYFEADVLNAQFKATAVRKRKEQIQDLSV